MRRRPEECTGVAWSRQSSSAIRHDSSRFGVPCHDLVVLGGLSAPSRVHSPQKKRPGVVVHDPNPTRMQERLRGKFRWGEIQNDDVGCRPRAHAVPLASSRRNPRRGYRGGESGLIARSFIWPVEWAMALWHVLCFLPAGVPLRSRALACCCCSNSSHGGSCGSARSVSGVSGGSVPR